MKPQVLVFQISHPFKAEDNCSNVLLEWRTNSKHDMTLLIHFRDIFHFKETKTIKTPKPTNPQFQARDIDSASNMRTDD